METVKYLAEMCGPVPRATVLRRVSQRGGTSVAVSFSSLDRKWAKKQNAFALPKGRNNGHVCGV